MRAARVVHGGLLYRAVKAEEHRRNVERERFLVSELRAGREPVPDDGATEPAGEALAEPVKRASAAACARGA